MRNLVNILCNDSFIKIRDNLYLHEKLNRSTRIYRYTKIPYAIELLDSKKFYVANRCFMSDQREKGKKKDNHNLFDDFLIAGTNVAQKERILEDNRKLKAECFQACVSCWTERDDDNILLWRYFGENTCRISTTIDNLTKLPSATSETLTAPITSLTPFWHRII